MDDLGRLYEEAIRAGERREYRVAVELFRKVVTKTDRYPHALLYLGRSYHALGQYHEAVQVLEFYTKVLPDSHAGKFFLGRAYLALGYIPRAIRNFKDVINVRPGFFPAQSLLGLAYLKLRRPNAAVAHFEKALELEPGNSRVRAGYLNAVLIKAMRLFHRQKLGEAEELFHTILSSREDCILGHIYLARIYRLRERDDLALEHYERAARLAPEDPVFPLLKAVAYLHLGNTETAFKELSKISHRLEEGAPRTDDPQVLLKFVVITLFRNRRYREAITYAKQILRKDYRDADTHALVAESYLNLEEYEKAKNHYLRCLDSNRSELVYHYGLAMSLWSLADYEELIKVSRSINRINKGDRTARYFYTLAMAEMDQSPEDTIKSLQELIRTMGPDGPLMFALGREYLKYDMPELSEGWFKRALKLDKQHRGALLSLVRAYQGMKKEQETRRTIARYVGLFPDDRSLRHEYIRLLLNREEYEEASQQILALLPAEPANRQLKKGLARCHFHLGRFSDAALLYRDLLRDEPRSLPLLRFLVHSLDKSGNRSIAIGILERAASFFKGVPEVLNTLGVLYSRAERNEEAKQMFLRVVEINPGDWRVYQNLAQIYDRTGHIALAAQYQETADRHRKTI
jgi:tetratricopeptide (TPR) repeat protein